MLWQLARHPSWCQQASWPTFEHSSLLWSERCTHIPCVMMIVCVELYTLKAVDHASDPVLSCICSVYVAFT